LVANARNAQVEIIFKYIFLPTPMRQIKYTMYILSTYDIACQIFRN